MHFEPPVGADLSRTSPIDRPSVDLSAIQVNKLKSIIGPLPRPGFASSHPFNTSAVQLQQKQPEGKKQ
jgi:hypothetical protein